MKPNYENSRDHQPQPSEQDVHDRKMQLYLVLRQRLTRAYIKHLSRGLDVFGLKLSQDLDGHADLAMATLMAMLLIKNQRMMKSARMVDMIAQTQLQPDIQKMITETLDENTKP